MKILLIGPPASGKGTQARLLGEYLRLPAISVGKMLRAIPKDHNLYELLHRSMDVGLLPSQEIVGDLLKEELSNYIYKNGYILDGWYRNLGNMQYLDLEPDKVLYLELPYEESNKRTTARRVCEQNGHSYNLIYSPPKKSGICDIDHSKLIQREDDKEEVLKRRWEVFTEQTVPCINYFKNKKILYTVDASKTPEEIFKEAKKVLMI